MKTRYHEITTDLIKNIKREVLIEDPYCLLKQEFNTLDDAIPLTGGRISRVYKIKDDGIERVLKISMGLYRMTELMREAEALKNISIDGGGHFIPQIFKSKSMKNYAYLIEEYFEGESVREKLINCQIEEERAKIWKGLGQILSEVHNFYNREDSEGRWLDEQLEMSRINMENDMIDAGEFEEEPPEKMLEWLNLNKPKRKQLSLIHGDFRTKNILIDNYMRYKVIDWGFVDIGDPYYDLAIIDYYFKCSDDREGFYKGYKANAYNKGLIEYYDKLSKFINV
ncbi:aminoglycoside phosphotransferase APH(3') [Alkaliphilus transvaalensis]|uniref:aminoglycoside phosphotransferase APH(3') n=1 Tax=Alkaliphilus transvaalensis TaxID=114628 RepID=UPI00047E5357|nr:aminoglycoside phosphotransferase APH(3') [Alkaliphilus transvaalensis]